MKQALMFTAQALLGSAALFGCAASGPQSPEVKPVFDVRHAMAPAEAYHQLGRYFQGQGEWARAEDAFRKAIALHARYWEAHNGLGAVLALQGRYDAAREAFEAALAIAPDVDYLHGNLRHLERLGGGVPPPAVVGALPAPLPVAPLVAAHPLVATAQSHEALGLVVIAATATLPPIEVVGASDVVAATETGVYVIADASPAAAPAATAALEDVVARADLALTIPVWPVPDLQVAWAAHTGSAPVHTMAGEPPIVCRLEVANGNGVTGMARYVGKLLAADGLPRARLSNQKPFVEAQTRIEYRAGFEAQARTVSDRLPGRPDIVAAAMLRPATDVRVVLGHDLPRTLDFALNARPVDLAVAKTLPDY